jgi:hypothetical protein
LRRQLRDWLLEDETVSATAGHFGVEEMGPLILVVALADKSLHRGTFVLDAIVIVADRKADNVGSRQSQRQGGSGHEGSNSRLLEEHGEQ